MSPAAIAEWLECGRPSVFIVVAVLRVERSGRILAREVGGFEEQKAERLAAWLAPMPSPTAMT